MLRPTMFKVVHMNGMLKKILFCQGYTTCIITEGFPLFCSLQYLNKYQKLATKKTTSVFSKSTGSVEWDDVRQRGSRSQFLRVQHVL